jgi:hypothetical protein
MIGEVHLGVCFSWGGMVLCDPDLTPACKLVCMVLEKFMSPVGEMVWPGKTAIAQLTGFDEKRVEKALEEARNKKFLKYVRFADTPVYHPAWPTGRGFAIPAAFTTPALDDAARVVVRLTEDKAKAVLEQLYGPEALERRAYTVFVEERKPDPCAT